MLHCAEIIKKIIEKFDLQRLTMPTATKATSAPPLFATYRMSNRCSWPSTGNFHSPSHNSYMYEAIKKNNYLKQKLSESIETVLGVSPFNEHWNEISRINNKHHDSSYSFIYLFVWFARAKGRKPCFFFFKQRKTHTKNNNNNKRLWHW